MSTSRQPVAISLPADQLGSLAMPKQSRRSSHAATRASVARRGRGRSCRSATPPLTSSSAGTMPPSSASGSGMGLPASLAVLLDLVRDQVRAELLANLSTPPEESATPASRGQPVSNFFLARTPPRYHKKLARLVHGGWLD